VDDEYDHDAGTMQFGEAYIKGQFNETIYFSFYVMNQLSDNRFVASDGDTG
jgi:hypothetical protein